MNISIHIDIKMNFDFHISINMNIEYYIKYYLLGIPYWLFPIRFQAGGIEKFDIACLNTCRVVRPWSGPRGPSASQAGTWAWPMLRT